ncbi:hypothetical protein, partial [Bacillus velezensis]|uniref:hypothetical protein n=1 Tax=Bacillus velezensis TaxID=492670 RepID=UPI001C92D00B
ISTTIPKHPPTPFTPSFQNTPILSSSTFSSLFSSLQLYFSLTFSISPSTPSIPFHLPTSFIITPTITTPIKILTIIIHKPYLSPLTFPTYLITSHNPYTTYFSH